MADEAQIRISLQARNADGTNFYQSQPTSFNMDMSRIKYTPGDINVPTTGVMINLAELVLAGIAWLQNTDPTNFITPGVYDNAKFYPYQEIGPEEFYLIKLSRYLNQEFVGTGTGTNADVNKWMAIADTAACILRVHAFDR